MYPQFVENQVARGMPDMRTRPFPNYYGQKLPEPYGVAPRHPMVYAGKPEAMASHEAMYSGGWNPSMAGQGFGGKPSLGKPEYPYMGQVSL